MRRLGVALFAALVAVVGCGASHPPDTPPPGGRAPLLEPAPPIASAAAEEEGPPSTAEEAKLTAMLRRVAEARGLPVRRRVRSRILDRDVITARLRAKVDREVPKEVVVGQGESLAALELIPADYDFVAGIFALLGGRIAGYYEPDDGTMYLVDDLGDGELEETLSHELVHALQDQSFSLGTMLKYAPGESDRIAAAHSLAEGDAMSGMLDALQPGSAQQVTDTALRRILNVSTAMSTAGAKAPRVLQASLTAPYADGFALVRQLRERGGWGAVDQAWRTLPATTEQLLHVDKLTKREPAVRVGVPPIVVLGAGWRATLDDVMGEQGLRIVLEEWVTRADAETAAAGWGGDRYVVAERDLGGQRRSIAFGWKLTMDSVRDVEEVTRVLSGRFGTACRERPQLGPVVWRSRGKDIAVAAGPFERDGLAAKGGGRCELSSRWADAILKAR